MIIQTVGAFAARVTSVRPHPHGDFIWLTNVDLRDGNPAAQIVFGGTRQIAPGDLVPVAPPGARVLQRCERHGERVRKMRARNYRGQRSHGMLCSLDELGWLTGGPNEVAILQDVEAGQSLDHLGAADGPRVVAGWYRALAFAHGGKIDVGRVQPAFA